MLIVGYVDHRCTDAAQDVLQLGAELLAQLGVEVAHRFIEQHQARPPQQGPPEGNALPLASREPGWFAVAQVLELQQFEHPVDLLFHQLGACAPQFRAEAEVALHAEVGIERVALEHQGNPAISGWGCGDVVIAEQDLPTAGWIKPRQQPQGGALAAATGSQQGQDFPRLNGQAERIEQLLATHTSPQLLQFQGAMGAVGVGSCGHPLMAPWVRPLTICR